MAGPHMTAAEWAACRDPGVMLAWLTGKPGRRPANSTDVLAPREPPSPRRLRLALAACCRRAWTSLGPAGRSAVEAAEMFADSDGSKRAYLEEVGRAAAVEAAQSQQFAPGNQANFAAAWLCGDLANPDQVLRACATSVSGVGPKDYEPAVYAAERAAQADVLREVFGDPFRAVTLRRAWLTYDVRVLSDGAYDMRCRETLPIVADALEDAGCDSAELLGHLRSPGPHALPGCWALDLVLGRE